MLVAAFPSASVGLLESLPKKQTPPAAEAFNAIVASLNGSGLRRLLKSKPSAIRRLVSLRPSVAAMPEILGVLSADELWIAAFLAGLSDAKQIGRYAHEDGSEPRATTPRSSHTRSGELERLPARTIAPEDLPRAEGRLGANLRAYSTVSVAFMPLAACPGSEQNRV
jgi:hypothetical protein